MNKVYFSSDPLDCYCKEIRDAAPILGLDAKDIEALLKRKRERELAKHNAKKSKASKTKKSNHLQVIFLRSLPKYL